MAAVSQSVHSVSSCHRVVFRVAQHIFLLPNIFFIFLDFKVVSVKRHPIIRKNTTTKIVLTNICQTHVFATLMVSESGVILSVSPIVALTNWASPTAGITLQLGLARIFNRPGP